MPENRLEVPACTAFKNRLEASGGLTFSELNYSMFPSSKIWLGAMRAENEFELEKNRIDVAIGEEEVLLQEIVVVLQPDLGKFSRIPGQVC